MKVLYVDVDIEGHHLPYIRALSKVVDQPIAILPQRVEELSIPQYICEFPKAPKRTLHGFLKWLREVKRVAKAEQPDIIHFLMGDVFYRFFGVGLGLFSRCNTVITLHWTRNGVLGKISTKCLAWAADKIIVHSDYIKQEFESYGIDNVEHIEYPQFGTVFYGKNESRWYWNLENEIPTIAFIGGTREDKGVDLLLEALTKVDSPFQLLIAGKEEFFKKDFIEKKIKPYKEKVRLHLEYLSDDELALAICATDIVVLPYRRRFTGASGPLVDGVIHTKMIVGPNHGNLGNTIEKNHLGMTFETESTDSLAKIIEKALALKWKPDDRYREYQKNLSPEKFQKEHLHVYQKLDEQRTKQYKKMK